jgi:diguanylate cyclase (GGDEF)-like protein
MRRRQVPAGQPYRRSGAIPPSAMLVSLMALVVAAVAAVMWPESLRDYSALAWLLALVPCMLLAYYKGWRGAAIATALTMTIIILTHALLVLWLQTAVDWRLLGVVAFSFVSVSLVVGVLSQLHMRDREREVGAAYADVETGLPNERILDLFLIRYFATARRGQELAAVAFEIDKLGAYRSKRGAVAASKVLSTFARILDSNTRVMDVCSRYGDNLFVCLLPRTGSGGAFAYALRVRKAVESSAMLKGTGITVSGGVAAYMPAMGRRTDLIEAACEALHEAIEAGRNRVMVCVASEDGDIRPIHAADGTSIARSGGVEDSPAQEDEDAVSPAGSSEAVTPVARASRDAVSSAGRERRKPPIRTSLISISRERRR